VSEPIIDDESAQSRVERHASWAELFFDLVAVAGVAALSHVLVFELNAATVGLYALLFLAFWLTWTTFMLYGNVAAGQTHVLRMLGGMFGLGVMAAAVPGVAHNVLDHGATALPLNVFAIAYIATRIYGSQSWRRGQILVDFPVVQYSGGLLPWVVSIWVDEPWKLVLWAVGAGLDLLLIVVLSGNRMMVQLQARLTARTSDRRQRRASRAKGKAPAITALSVDAKHLAERLGLFVIIVLG